MAIVTNTFLTFSGIGNREDLVDVIHNVSPIETPFQANVDKTKATATNHEWQTDALAAAAQNVQLEGDDITTFGAVTATTRLGNRIQISFKSVIVSDTQDAVNKAGRKKEIVYQLMLRSKELRRDMEFDLLSNQSQTTGNSTTAPQLRPVTAWYSTNDNFGVGGAAGSTSAGRTDGTLRDISETTFKQVLQDTWAQSAGNVNLVLCREAQKVRISGFVGGATRTIDAMKEEVRAAIDIYVSDWGRHRIVADRFGRTRDIHMLNTDYWAIAYLKPMYTVDLAKTGLATKGMIAVQYTLESRNQASSGLYTDINP